MDTIADEVIELLCDGIRSAGEQIDYDQIEYEDDEHGRILYTGPLPGLLAEGVIVGRLNPAVDIIETGRRIAHSLKLLRQDADAHASSIERGLKRAERMTGTRTQMLMVLHTERMGGLYRISAIVEVETLDDYLQPTKTRTIIDGNGFDDDLHTMRTLRGQKARHAARQRGVVVEWALARAAGDALPTLLEYLRQSPTDPGAAAWESGAWTAKRLAEHGVHLPPAVETVRIQHGRVFGRIRLSKTTTWTDGTLLHGDATLPSIAMEALVGKPLSKLIEHAVLPVHAVMSRVTVDGHGQVRAKTTPIDQTARK